MNQNIETQIKRGSNHVVYDVVAAALLVKYDDVVFLLTNGVRWIAWLGGRDVVQCAAGDMGGRRQLR